MKNLLVTGFEPFDGEQINPSWEALLRLPEKIQGCRLTKLQIPVVFDEAASTVIREAERIGAEAILCIGQAGGRSAMTPEVIGINLRHGRIPDNRGYRPEDEAILPGGAAAYFSTLPVRRMVAAMQEIGVPAQLSYSAGVYVCNEVLYRVLAHFSNTAVSVGFLHVPYSEEQNKQPSMNLDLMVKGLTAAIEVVLGTDGRVAKIEIDS